MVDISDIQVRIKNFIAFGCYSDTSSVIGRKPMRYQLADSPYTFSNVADKFTVVGCNNFALIQGSDNLNFTSRCAALCSRKENVMGGDCSGVVCCQTPIPKGLKYIYASLTNPNNHTNVWSFNPRSYAFLGAQEQFHFRGGSNFSDPTFINGTAYSVPVVLDWVIGNRTCNEARKDLSTYACKENSNCYDSDNGPGYRCQCNQGFKGNPYLSPGCQGLFPNIQKHI